MSATKSKRLVSLDAFRGITIAGMILVNNPGSWSHIYPPLGHAPWHGWTPTDLIFPFFLFIVGVAIVFALDPQRLQDQSIRSVHWKIIRRALILFGLGLFLAAFPYFKVLSIRIPGVLQRIAIVYLVTSLLFIHSGIRFQALAGVALLILYWALMKLVPVPGYGAGDLSVEGNLAAFVDNALLHGHMWKDTWDPEGLLSTIPAISTGLSGVLVGHLLRAEIDKQEKAAWLFVLGWGAIILGLIWSIWFPINKNIWTSSYVVFTAGAAMQFLGVCYWLIDCKGWQGWAKPAVMYGMNAITVFVLSGLVARLTTLIKVTTAAGGEVSLKSWLYQNVFASWAGPLNGSLAFAVFNVLVFLAVAAVMYRRRIFIKI